LSIAQWHEDVQEYGTPEKGYLDSGFWKYLGYVKTKDSHDHDNPVKALMADAPVYLIIVFLYMLAAPVLAIPKSRQMRMSWATSCFAYWHTIQGSFRETFVQLQSEADSHAMITMGDKNPLAGRMDFIAQTLPGWLRDPNIMSGKGNNVGRLQLSSDESTDEGVFIPWRGSYVQALPGGPKQVRGKTPSLFVSDESAFQDEFEACVTAINPAVKGGGRFISISSVDAGSHFNNMVLESFDGSPPEHKIHPVVEVAMKMLKISWPKGMRSWETPSGVYVLEVHYTSDPAKDPARDGKKWYDEAVKGYIGGIESSGWKTEMEIDYKAGGGDPVFPFAQSAASPIFIASIDPKDAIRDMEIYAGYDYGADSPSAMPVWGIDKNRRPHALWELYEPCLNIQEHTDKMKACPYWEHINYIVCDPSIMSKTQQTANGKESLAEQFAKYGVTFRRGRRAADVPNAVRFLTEYWGNPLNPTAFITADCPAGMSEVRDLRWERHLSQAVERRKNNPGKIRDKNNHWWDATSYLFDTLPGFKLGPTPKRPSGPTFQDFLDSHASKSYSAKHGGGITTR